MKMNKENIIEELQDLKAENLLNQMEASQDIPADYFENLSKDFLAKVKAEESKVPAKKVSIRRFFLPFSIAAALLISVAIPLLNNNSKTETVTWDQFSTSDFQSYIEENIGEFSDEEIASVAILSDNSIFMDTEISNEILEEYLTEMDVEETLF